MSDIPRLRDALLTATVQYDIERETDALYQLEPALFESAVEAGYGSDPITSDEEEIVDRHDELLDNYDAHAEELFGRVAGYYLKEVEIGKIVLSNRANSNSTHGPKLRHTVLKATAGESEAFMLTKVAHKGPSSESQAVTEKDRLILASALAKLLDITAILKEQ